MSKLRILIGQTINAEAGESYTVLVQQHIPSFLNPFFFHFLTVQAELCMVFVD